MVESIENQKRHRVIDYGTDGLRSKESLETTTCVRLYDRTSGATYGRRREETEEQKRNASELATIGKPRPRCATH